MKIDPDRSPSQILKKENPSNQMYICSKCNSRAYSLDYSRRQDKPTKLSPASIRMRFIRMPSIRIRYNSTLSKALINALP